MAEPTGTYTFPKLMTEVARTIGVAFYGASGGEAAMPPVHERHDFELVRDIVNGGVKLFIGTPPDNGWHWRKRLHSVTFDPDGTGPLNIDSDPARYYLPQDFGGVVAGKIQYAAGTAHGSRIEWCNESRIRQRRATTVQTGYPVLAAVRPYNYRRYELVVDPQPAAADTVEFPYLSQFDEMALEGGVATGGTAATLVDTKLPLCGYYPVDCFKDWELTIISGTGKGETATVTAWDPATGTFSFAALSGGSTPDTTSYYIVQPENNCHPAGLEYDSVILTACLAFAESIVENFQQGWEQRLYSVALPAAYRVDRMQAGRNRTLGKMSNGPREHSIRVRNEVEFLG